MTAASEDKEKDRRSHRFVILGLVCDDRVFGLLRTAANALVRASCYCIYRKNG